MSLTILIIIGTAAASIAAFYNERLMEQWILNPYMVNTRRQWARMLTSGFLHADWFHLLINMYVLYLFGQPLEDHFRFTFGSNGAILYLLLYFSAIVIANISTYIKFKENINYNALGASGATSALVFAVIMLVPYEKSIGILFIPPGILPNIVFGVLYLIYCVFMSRRKGDNINHDAHFYGALYGALFMIILQPGIIRNLLQFN